MYCNFVQWRLSYHLENGTPPAVWLIRHMQTCFRCRQRYRMLQQVDQQLQTQDPDLPDFDLEEFHNRVFTRLSRNLQVPARRSKNLRFTLIPAAGLAAALLITAVLWWPHRPSRPSHADLVRFNQLMNTEIDSLSSAMIRQPMQKSLEKEIQNLTQDMEKGIQFVAACLPGT